MTIGICFLIRTLLLVHLKNATQDSKYILSATESGYFSGTAEIPVSLVEPL